MNKQVRSSGVIRVTYLFVFLMTVALTSGAGETIPGSINNKKDHVASPVINEKTEYYEVCGSCEKDVQSELQEKCIKLANGEKYDSITNWKVKWDYSHSRDSETCTAESFVVTVDIVYRLPKFVRKGEVSQTLVEKWDRYMENLLMHEKGHRDRAVASAKELTRLVAELPPARTCAELDRLVNTLCRTRLDKLIEVQKIYDADTCHGVLQAAEIP
jgi:predicted secreted Zn-dependent protease